jgi:uncharacterized protein
MKPIQIAPGEAKNIILRSQLLEGRRQGKTKSATFEIINQLGYLQIDTISVVERAHHHILWSRQPDYEPEWLIELQEQDRKLFEYWGHAAAYLPMTDYRFYRYKMKHFLNTNDNWFKNKLKLCENLIPLILDRIRTEGGLSSRDFKSAPQKKGEGWWDWKPAKIALELLFWQGVLMVSKRVGFQKVYDLPERVVPDFIDQTEPTPDEVCEFQIKKALKTLGLASEKDIQYILKVADKKNIAQFLKTMVNHQQLKMIRIGKLNDIYFALTETLDQYLNTSLKYHKIHVLSPFDNLIINRRRLKTIFGFDFTIECYVPAAKRKYGYFCLPILYKGNFIGRFDFKADRKNKILIFQQMHFEKNTKFSEVLFSGLAKKLIEFMKFNQCQTINYSKQCSGDKFKKLKNQIKSLD